MTINSRENHPLYGLQIEYTVQQRRASLNFLRNQPDFLTLWITFEFIRSYTFIWFKVFENASRWQNLPPSASHVWTIAGLFSIHCLIIIFMPATESTFHWNSSTVQPRKQFKNPLSKYWHCTTLGSIEPGCGTGNVGLNEPEDDDGTTLGCTRTLGWLIGGRVADGTSSASGPAGSWMNWVVVCGTAAACGWSSFWTVGWEDPTMTLLCWRPSLKTTSESCYIFCVFWANPYAQNRDGKGRHYVCKFSKKHNVTKRLIFSGRLINTWKQFVLALAYSPITWIL